MIDGDVKEFVDNLYYGTEMYFLFRGKKYFVQGWYEDGIHHLTLEIEEPYDSKDPLCQGYVWSHESKERGECAQAFLNAPIWDGKKFYEVEKEMTWTD